MMNNWPNLIKFQDKNCYFLEEKFNFQLFMKHYFSGILKIIF